MEFDVLHIKAAVVADNSLAFFRITWGILDVEISLPERKASSDIQGCLVYHVSRFESSV